jgi:hypothetical protein
MVNVTPAPPLAHGERVLVAANDRTGAPYVATTHAFYRRDGDDDSWQRLGWEQTRQVHWDPRPGTLRLTALVPGAPTLTLGLGPHPAIAALARERFAATRLLAQRVPLGDQGAAVVIARRPPGAAQPTWIVVLDEGVDPDDADVRARVSSAIRRLRAETGV